MLRHIVQVAVTSILLVSGFDYDRCAEDGPANWPGSCVGQTEGTPINLCGAELYPDAPLMSVMDYDIQRTMTILNNGHTIQIGITSDNPMLEVGTLSNIVGRSSSTTPETWILEQIHLHWGRTGKNNEGSEHYVEGVQYPLEAHLVHFNSLYSNVSDAVSSGETDALLVVGIMFELGSTDEPVISTMAQAAQSAESTATQMSQQVQLSTLFDGTGDFYFYAGSLTTPPCTAAVTWVVMTQHHSITSATLQLFKDVYINPANTSQGLISDEGNFRPLEPLSGRTVYLTNGSSSPCGDVMEPEWDCSSEGDHGGEGGDATAAPTKIKHSSAIPNSVPTLLSTIVLPIVFLFACNW